MNHEELAVELEALRTKSRSWKTRLRLENTERAFRESQERFRLLYENAPLGYQSLDENGHVIEEMLRGSETLGYTREEIIGRWFGDFLTPSYVEHFRTNFPRSSKLPVRSTGLNSTW